MNRKPRIYKSGDCWCVVYGSAGGVYPTFALACEAARHLLPGASR